MDDCEKFLAGQEPWIRAVLNGESGSPEIAKALARNDGIEALNSAQDRYEELLKRCPEHLREYRKIQRKLAADSATAGLPRNLPGRPRQDRLAQEARELKKGGLSYAAIARELNHRYPSRKDRKGNELPVTPEAVRKMLSRVRGKTPDKN